MSLSPTPPHLTRRRSRVVGSLPIRELLGLVVGLLSLGAAIAIALSVDPLVGFAQYTVRLLASLGVALACMALTGFVEIQGRLLPFQVRAGGALAIFVAVLFVPPELIRSVEEARDPAPENPEINGRIALEMLEQQDWAGLDALSDQRCTQGTKYESLPKPALQRPMELGKPTSREPYTTMNNVFPAPPNDPTRLVIFKEIRPTGTLYSTVNLVSSGPDDDLVWALCGITYGHELPK